MDPPDVTDRRLAKAAAAKQARKQTPTGREQSALKRVRKWDEIQQRQKLYKTIPKGDWVSMSGRQVKVLHGQADRWGIPLRGARIDLTAVVVWLHDFLAKNAHRLAGDDTTAAASPALEAYRTERAELVKLDRLERRNQLIARDDMKDFLAQCSAKIRTVGERLQRKFGVEAQDVLNDALDECDELISDYFGADETGGDS